MKYKNLKEVLCCFSVKEVSLLSWSGEDFVSLTDTSLEKVIVSHHGFDVVQLKVDQHTSNLWSLLWAENSLDKLEEDSTSLILVVWIVWHHSWKNLVALSQEVLVNGHGLLLLLLLLLVLLLLHHS